MSLHNLPTDTFLLIVRFVSGNRIHLLKAHRRFWVYRWRVLWFIERDQQKLLTAVPNEVLQLRLTRVALRWYPETLRSFVCNVYGIDDVCRNLPNSLMNLEFYSIDHEINCSLLPAKLQTLCLRLQTHGGQAMQSIEVAHLSDLRELTLEGCVFRLGTLSPNLQRFTWTAEFDNLSGSRHFAKSLCPNRSILQTSTSLAHIDISSDVVFHHLDLPQHSSFVFLRLRTEHYGMNNWWCGTRMVFCHLQTLIIDEALNRVSAKELPPTLTCLYQSEYLVQSLNLSHLTSLRTLGSYIQEPTTFQKLPPVLVQLPSCLETLITSPFCVDHFLNLDRVRNLRIRAKDVALDETPSINLWSKNIRTLSDLVLACPKVELFHIDTRSILVNHCLAWQTSLENKYVEDDLETLHEREKVSSPIFVRQQNDDWIMHFQCMSCEHTQLRTFYLWSRDFTPLYRSSYVGHRFEFSRPCDQCSLGVICEACTYCRNCGIFPPGQVCPYVFL